MTREVKKEAHTLDSVMGIERAVRKSSSVLEKVLNAACRYRLLDGCKTLKWAAATESIALMRYSC